MSANGSRPRATKATLSLTLDPETGQVAASIPKDLAVAYGMLRSALDIVIRQALNPEPERKVKTLDEFGMRR